MTDDSLTINIDILQRQYSVRVKRQDEEIFRQASQSIEQSVQKYASKGMNYRDKQDLLAMALLETTVVALKNKKESTHLTMNNQVFDKLKSVESFLSDSLK